MVAVHEDWVIRTLPICLAVWQTYSGAWVQTLVPLFGFERMERGPPKSGSPVPLLSAIMTVQI